MDSGDTLIPGRCITSIGQTSVIFYKLTVHSDFIHLEISFPCHSLKRVVLNIHSSFIFYLQNVLTGQLTNCLNWCDYMGFLQFDILTSYLAILGFSKKKISDNAFNLISI